MFKKGVDFEPVLVLDTTGSQTYPVAEGSSLSRWEVVTEAMGIFVSKLGAEDAQAAKEKAAGEDAGGLMTITFAGGEAKVLGDLSPENYKAKLKGVQLGGHTEILPGWNEALQNYMDEFQDEPVDERPQMLALVITDGEADDTDAFAAELVKAGSGKRVLVAIVGFGDEHDRALAAYKKVAEQNDRVRVMSFDSQTDPNVVAGDLLKAAGAS
jgi:hypothetical protein